MELLIKIGEVALLGIIGGAVPGPMLTSVLTGTLSDGFKKGFVITMRALFAEAIFAFLILLLFFSWQVPYMFFYVISFGGALVLFWLAKQVWNIKKIDADSGKIFSLWRMIVLTALSGAFWIFWIMICIPRAFELRQIIVGGQYLFLAVFEISWLVMTLFIAFVFSRFRSFLDRKKLVPYVFRFFALMLCLFALKSIWFGASNLWS
ncbi:MAG: LysE family transporter [Candidatus Gracilibacteria bacterium]|jgi:threonine/homoserine/homoserine lactone efflux protein